MNIQFYCNFTFGDILPAPLYCFQQMLQTRWQSVTSQKAQDFNNTTLRTLNLITPSLWLAYLIQLKTAVCLNVVQRQQKFVVLCFFKLQIF